MRVEGFHEKYRRFSYRDIRAIVIRKTNVSLVGNILLGVILLPIVLGCAFAQDFAVRGVLGMVSLMLFGVLMLNLARGPSCACYIHTAVQTDRLPAVDRVKKARRLIESLRPRIVPANERV